MKRLLLVAGLTLGAAAALMWGTSSYGNSHSTPVTFGAYVVSSSADRIVVTATGPVGIGKLSGSTFTTRVTGDTRFTMVRRGQSIGPNVPVTVTVDATPDGSGVYRLLAIEGETR